MDKCDIKAKELGGCEAILAALKAMSATNWRQRHAAEREMRNFEPKISATDKLRVKDNQRFESFRIYIASLEKQRISLKLAVAAMEEELAKDPISVDEHASDKIQESACQWMESMRHRIPEMKPRGWSVRCCEA